jgi:hypothetical protein
MPVFHIRWPLPKESLFALDDGSSDYEVWQQTGRPQEVIKRQAGAQADIEANYPSPGSNGEREVAACELGPGEHYARIFRPAFPGPLGSQRYARTRRNCEQAVRTLLADMHEVFRVVEPVEANLRTYGHDIRHLLILACNEVETNFRSVLRANGYPEREKPPWNMGDYAKLRAIMRLDEWEVSLSRYPDIPPFKPFAGWGAAQPRWYAEHHAVKHDREVQFPMASLDNMVKALGAAYVLVCAQFGVFGNYGFGAAREADHFWLSAQPRWLTSEYYAPPRTGHRDEPRESWREVQHRALKAP